MRFPHIVLLLVIMLLTGCSAAHSSNTIIEYQRTGGFLNREDRLVLHADGHGVITQAGQQRPMVLTPDELQHLVGMIEAAGFRQLRQAYRAPASATDLVTYQIIYDGYRVSVMDTAIPVVLQSAIDSLNTIIDSLPLGAETQQL